MSGQFYQFGPWSFDVDKALKIIEKSPRKPQKIDVWQWARSLCVMQSQEENRKAGKIPLLVGDVDEEYARTADLTIPLLFITLQHEEEQSHMLIDGTHRLRGAVIHGYPTLPAHLLTVEESLEIRSGPPTRRRLL
jgi:hypothetical protein